MSFPTWPPGTVVSLVTGADDGPYVIPVSAALRAPDGSVLLALAQSRGSLARLRADPRVAVLILAAGDLAVTLYGTASVAQEELVPRVAAVRVAVERTADHNRPTFVIESGVGWHWTDAEADARDAEIRAALITLAGPAGPAI
jgi:hypothetical protein